MKDETQAIAQGDGNSKAVEAAHLFQLIDDFLRPHGRGAQKLLRDYVELVKAILAAAPAVSAPAWQPIETAPKDGTAILLGSRGGAWVGKWLPVFTSGYTPDNPWSSLMLNHDHMGEKWCRPTHWQPLPAAPVQAPVTQDGDAA